MNITEKRQAITELLNAQAGKIFTVHFVGKDGKPHTTNSRLGVCKYSHGGRNNADNHPELRTVFSVQKLAYRNVYLDGVTKISAMGHEFLF